MRFLYKYSIKDFREERGWAGDTDRAESKEKEEEIEAGTSDMIHIKGTRHLKKEISPGHLPESISGKPLCRKRVQTSFYIEIFLFFHSLSP